ncbi:MutS2 family protein [Marvinbryantia formatexigens DSM 14469]|uniref:Endonuclease MutS2 n=1 Tax=Marvinbryantia formatexigens DSM 14469 TaxID=478749 RepID=C6LD47_9FIRM|nr:endonuclease MutS2 [Marvinbryantia formatexigens]EET61530.1 MutS2 family protein [Marvinbryantia formatexigens DSM 14469]UWO26177.1 endonuclease MutS2 [Marvinbryantia formatexigens DSM 14469]SDF93436.1 DNA mismatch repair protein MutS2 [Marvinbryantia formatexigens]
MNTKVLKTLEYHKIIDRLTELAGSTPGKELCKNLLPSSDIEEIRMLQAETSLALSMLYQKGHVSFSGVTNIRGSLKRLEVGSILSPAELLAICRLLEVTNRVKAYSRKENSEEEPNALDVMFEALQPLTPLANEIRRCLPSEEEISDDASPALRSIRRAMRQMNDKVHAQLNSMVNGSAKAYLQDAVVTMRNGRYCLPVKAEYRGQVQGMIHDQSSTGSTLFIEPMAVIKLNNELRELEIKEEKEIEVILANLSGQAGVEQEALESNLTLLTKLDFIFARAQLSKSYDGSEPVLNNHGVINIKKGRHPLLDKKTVVPIDIRLGQDFDLLIITGPNTGGKTVSLKTVGLFTLMGQSGLHIPAFDGSELAVFDDVFADIGDEQSIEQSLSTFSAHMTNIVSILKEANERSLVLFDELGAGTDPTEGAALAIAVLSNLHRQGIRTMATTHYSELKVFALSTPGVENGCCEFNVETLRPTYRLLIGIPGKSNAFAISAKLGLPEDIIEEAREQLSQQDEDFESLISDLETSRVTIEREREEINHYKEEIERLKQRLEQKQETLDASRERILREANEQAHAILREAKEYADTTIKNFNKFGKQGIDSRAMEQERSRLREKMSSVEKNLAIKTQRAPAKTLQAKDLHLGDSVRVLSMNLKGTVSTLPNAKGDLFVQMGILRSQVNIKDLEKIADVETAAPYKHQTGSGKIKMSKSASVGTEINLLGKTTDEAIAELDKYLDDAYLSHMPSVRIVHGKGTGALRKAVHNYLRRQKYVESYRLGEFGEGDAGVTIVKFRS